MNLIAERILTAPVPSGLVLAVVALGVVLEWIRRSDTHAHAGAAEKLHDSHQAMIKTHGSVVEKFAELARPHEDH